MVAMPKWFYVAMQVRGRDDACPVWLVTAQRARAPQGLGDWGSQARRRAVSHHGDACVAEVHMQSRRPLSAD